jgi:hypothetical protein
MSKYRIFTIFAALTVLSLPSFAQFDDEEVRHVIVSVDTRTSNTISRTVVLDSLLRLINRNGLVRENDYVSVLQYSVGVNDPRFRNYVRIPKSEGKSYVFTKTKKNELGRIFNEGNWSHFESWNSGQLAYSLSSVAKPYSIAALKTDSILVNRTYVILVTDHIYNGGDFYQELTEWTKHSRSPLKQDDIMQKCYSVAREYFLSYMETIGIPSIEKGSVFLDLYEFVPLNKNVSFPSVFFFPPTVKAQRVQGRGYRIRVEFSNTNPDRYDIKRMEVTPKRRKGAYGRPTVFNDGKTLTYQTYAARRNDIDSLQVRAWLRIRDGFYDATLLTPQEGCSPGLDYKIPVEYPEDEKLLFGIPLTDELWFIYKDDQKLAAQALSWIIGALAFIILALIFKRLKKYRPKNSQIHLS